MDLHVSEPASNPAGPWNGGTAAPDAEPVVAERLTVTAETAIVQPSAPDTYGDTGRPRVQLPDLPEDPDAGSVVQLALATAVETFLDHDEASAHGDVRGVHQARVGLRRFRSHLRTFRRVIDTEWASALSAEASWLADALGRVRDLDVLNARLVEGAMLQLPEHAPAIAGLVSVLEDQREEALDVLRGLRETARFDGLVGRLVEAAQKTPTRGRAEEPAEFLLPSLIRRSWHELNIAAKKARKDETVENLHTVRIRAKRMRYASEASTAVLGAPAKKAAKAAEALQEHLGEWHDACAARDWLEQAGEDRPDLAAVAIRLAALQSEEAAGATKDWESLFKDIKKSWRKLDRKARVRR